MQAVFGLGNQHAGDEGAKGQRQAGQLGQRGEAEGDQQHVEDEHLGRLGPRDEVEPSPHQLLAEHQNHGEDDDGLEQGDADQHRQLFRRLRQRRNDDQQRHHREILKEQHAEYFPAVRRVELHAFGEQLGQHGGRGHRKDAAEGDAELPVDAGKHDQTGDQQHADRDLEQAKAEDDALHRVELGQRKLEADREHQEDDAEFGEILDAMHVIHQVEGMRADDAADQ